MSDARFEDADEAPLRLKAESVEDLPVLSTLLQDAVLDVGDISWMPKRRRLALLLNRFRWEDRAAAERAGREFERARALLTIDSALKVSSNGISPTEADQVLSLLSLSFEAAEDGAGRLLLVFAGDGILAVDVECIDLRLGDVTRPYAAPSGRVPQHDP